MTLSFWIKTTITGTYCVSFRNPGDQGATNGSAYIAEYTVSSANTWEYKTITVTTPASYPSAIGVEPNPGLVVAFAFCCGSTNQATAGSWQSSGISNASILATSNQVNALSSAANDIFFADIRLQPGVVDKATISPLASEIANLCYYWVQGGQVKTAGAQTNTTTVTSSVVPWSAQSISGPNIAPTAADITLYDNAITAGSLNWIGVTNVSTSRASTVTTSSATTTGFQVQQTAALDYVISGFWLYRATTCTGMKA